jgi:hypothetical protein
MTLGQLLQARLKSKNTQDRKVLFDKILYRIVEDIHPCSVRGVYYQAIVHDLVEKDAPTDAPYQLVQVPLLNMREKEVIPWDWITDNSRQTISQATDNSLGEALRHVARWYRQSVWKDLDVQVQVWIEKDALAGVVESVTRKYDVALKVARGFSSGTFLHEAGEEITDDGRPAFIYQLGDFDPSGNSAVNHVRTKLPEYFPDVDVHFERLAVLPEQIKAWKLPGHRTNTRGTHWPSFFKEYGKGTKSVDLDAINPHQLRKLVEDAIKQHLPKAHLASVDRETERVRTLLQELAEEHAGDE